MRWWIRALTPWIALQAAAGPVEFGRAELDRAIAGRNLKLGAIRPLAELSAGVKPEAFEIVPWRISGGDLRGLMYGLLDAAEQIRATGRLAQTKQEPQVPIRGVRLELLNDEWERENFHSRPFWTRYFQMLARSRFNRFHLAFGVAPPHWTPPYPYLFSLRLFPQVEAAGAPAFERGRNLDTLRMIAQTAADYAVDFTAGIWAHEPGEPIRGWNPDFLISYTRAAIGNLLAECPQIRGVYFHVQPGEVHQSLLRDAALRAVGEAGRRVVLEIPKQASSEDLPHHAKQRSASLRLVDELPAGRWYPPLDSFERQMLPVLRSVHASPYADPDFVRRLAAGVLLGGAQGYEVHAPATVETAQSEMFYGVWGRTTYAPGVSDRVWKSGLERRFGGTAADVAQAIAAAGRAAERFEGAPLETVQMLHRAALEAEQAIARVKAKLADSDEGWNMLESDLYRQAALARFRARSTWAAHLAGLYHQTQHDSLLYAARNELRGALRAGVDLPQKDLATLGAELERFEDLVRRHEAAGAPAQPAMVWPVAPPRPGLFHVPFKLGYAGKPLSLVLNIWPLPGLVSVRLNYKHLPNGRFETIEASPRAARFTIPAAELEQPGQLLYYFEIVHAHASWRLPDARAGSPVFVLRIVPEPKAEATPNRQPPR